MMKKDGTASTMSYSDRLHILTHTAIITAITCIMAPMSIPVGSVPISFTNLVIYLSLYLVGWKLSVLSVSIYILIGLIGLPVFSGFTGGVGKLVGPTGGYIVGFIPMAILAGLVIEKCSKRTVQFLGLVLGTALCYILGTVWYCYETEAALGAALGMCVLPFVPVDLIKIVMVMLMAQPIKDRLVRSGLLKV